MHRTLKENPLSPFLILLMLVVFSRFLITFVTTTVGLPSPEQTYKITIRGNDFYQVMVYQASHMIQGKPFDIHVGYGPASSILMAPIVHALCSDSKLLLCSDVLYHVYIVVVFVGFPILAFVSIKNPLRRNIALLVLTTFYLGAQAALGWERGNLDLIFGLVTGFLTILLFRKNVSAIKNFIVSGLTGFITGVMANTKIFYLPFSFVFLFGSPVPWVSCLFFIAAFFGFSFAPIFYGSKGNYLYPLLSGYSMYENISKNIHVIYPEVNHSLYSISSIFATCSYTRNCAAGWSHIVVVIGIIVFSFFVFVYPFITSGGQARCGNIRRNNALILLLLVYCDAAINLFPIFAFDYRTFYTVGLVLVSFSAIKTARAYNSFLLSLMFLLLKNIWLVPWQAGHVFLLIFYYFFLKALWIELLYATI